MGYIDKNLVANESIIYKAKLHWIIFFKAIICFVLGFFLLVVIKEANILVLAFFVLGAVFILTSLIRQKTTELAITNKRLIAKYGFINRSVFEMNVKKIEGFSIQQTLLGKILNYGTVVFSGTGGGVHMISCVSKPLSFRKKALEIADQAQEG